MNLSREKAQIVLTSIVFNFGNFGTMQSSRSSSPAILVTQVLPLDDRPPTLNAHSSLQIT